MIFHCAEKSVVGRMIIRLKLIAIWIHCFFSFIIIFWKNYRFGKVYKGLFKGEEVAIKQYSGLTKIDNDKEAQMFYRLRSPYVVSFYGICKSTNSLVIEFCKYGSVESCYKNKKLTKEVKALMCYDCAMGMKVWIFCHFDVIDVFIHLNLNSFGYITRKLKRTSIVFSFLFPFYLVSSCKRHHSSRPQTRQSFGRFVFKRHQLSPCEVIRFRHKPFCNRDDDDDGTNRHSGVYGSGSIWRWRIREKMRCLFVRYDCLINLHRENTVSSFFLSFPSSFYWFFNFHSPIIHFYWYSFRS